jgi:4-hydroxy-3-methylbut-2-enyl diphosphate reductase
VNGLIVCAALGIEARALRRGVSGRTPVIRVGYRARRAGRLPGYAALAVGGFGGALTTDLRPGDVVVATEIRGGRTVPCHRPEVLAAELRRLGLPAVTAPLLTTDHIVRRGESAALAATGAQVVDMESAVLAAGAGGRPVAAVRVVVDTPAHPLVRPGTIRHGTAAWRTLRRVGPAIERWAAAAG